MLFRSLDNTLEFLVMNGMELPMAVMICIPEPWSNNKSMPREKLDFYRYYATMMEPWDGPASIIFTDGDVMGAVLDRNGLRPSRYYVTTESGFSSKKICKRLSAVLASTRPPSNSQPTYPSSFLRVRAVMRSFSLWISALLLDNS